MGSGKTVFLKLIGQELQDRGCVLYFVVGAEMENFKQKYFHQLAQNAGDKTLVLLIDEVHNNVYSKHWNDLLRSGRPRNLLVLGVGIPRLAASSPHFVRKFPRENELFPMFLTSEDIPEVAAFFSKDSPHSKEVVTKLCEQVLVFTNGHFFPFVKIMEHVLSTEIEGDLSYISPYLSSQDFRNSESYESIKDRCLFVSDVLGSAVNIVANTGTEGDYANLERLGIVYNGYFISPLVTIEVFLKMKPKSIVVTELDESQGMESCTAQLICAGLSVIQESDFFDINGRSIAVENAISMKWGSNVRHALPTVQVTCQARTMYEDRKGRGAKPLIDFIFNGRLNLGVEVALNLNADGIKEHLQRFDDKYKILKEHGVVLHIDTFRSRPVQLQSLGEDSSNKVYTFLTTRNELYRGSTLIRSNVSIKLKAEYPTIENDSE